MFFRREKTHVTTFAERLAKVREMGFGVEQLDGKTRVVRDGCAADIKALGDDLPEVTRAGVLVGGEIGSLVDLGFQKVLRTPGGKQIAATAKHLTALHAFEEDLKESLGLKSLYNESLGTENNQHLYDRVEGRDAADRKRWQISPR